KNEVLIRMPQTITKENVGGGIDADKRSIIDALTQYYDNTPPDVRASKIDVNNSGRDSITNKLITTDPLGYRKSIGDASAEQEYKKVAAAIVDFRDNRRGGIIGDISEVPLTGFPPQLGEALKADFFTGDFSIVNAEIVGPQAGRELRNRAIYVTL